MIRGCLSVCLHGGMCSTCDAQSICHHVAIHRTNCISHAHHISHANALSASFRESIAHYLTDCVRLQLMLLDTHNLAHHQFHGYYDANAQSSRLFVALWADRWTPTACRQSHHLHQQFCYYSLSS